MSPQDIAKDAIRLVTTAGLSKDVIDLLEKKVALLTEKIATLETENSELKEKASNLENELKRFQTEQGELEDGAKQLLKLMFSAGGSAYLEELAGTIGMSKSMADYHADALAALGMIEVAALTPGGTMYVLTAKGRAYVVKNKLAE
jgi:FtsZ-binding cell division protein ZapB